MSNEPVCQFYRIGVCRLFKASVYCHGDVSVCRRKPIVPTAAWWRCTSSWLLIVMAVAAVFIESIWIPRLVMVLR